jgi:16S rRNA processing protein RimM
VKKQDTTLLFFGEALKTFGANGELIIKLNSDAPRKVNTKEPVFITIDGLSVPFYFKYAENKGANKLLVIFDDVETETLATELTGKKIYYASKQKRKAENDDLNIFIGYTLIDTTDGELGKITDFFDYPGNPCFQCFYNDKEIIVPVNEDLIESIDTNKQIIRVNLPTGLLDIYS